MKQPIADVHWDLYKADVCLVQPHTRTQHADQSFVKLQSELHRMLSSCSVQLSRESMAPAKAVHEAHLVSLFLGVKALMQLVEAVLQNPPCPTLTPSTSS